MIVNIEDKDALALFNPNAYPKSPEYIRETLFSCIERLSLMVYHARVIDSQIDKDIDYFMSKLSRQLRTVSSHRRLLAHYRSPNYLASLHGILYSFKSLLDLVAILWVRLISEEAKIRGFDRKDGIAGGKLIRWLRCTAPSSFHNRLQLAEIIEENSRKWITEAVSYRDTLIHRGEIDGLSHLTVRLGKEHRSYSREDANIPKMPDGKAVEDYCKTLLENTTKFVRAGLTLVPNVDTSWLKQISK